MKQFFITTKLNSELHLNCIPKLVHVCIVSENSIKIPRVMHAHNDRLELVFIREGFGVHTIGNKTYKTKKGDLLIYNCKVPHDERSLKEYNMSTYSCGISNLYMDNLNENCLIANNTEPIIHCAEHYEVVNNLFSLLCSQSISELDGFEETCTHLLCALITLIISLLHNSKSLLQENEHDIIERTIEFINKNYRKKINLKDIADCLGISAYYLAHLFKEKTGFSVMQYIINRRIGEAQNLLIDTKLMVTEISEKVGYDNSNYFNMLFNKIVGMPPGKFRDYLSVKEIDKDIFKGGNMNEIMF